MLSRTVLAASLALALFSPVRAEEAQPQPEIVVTATRVAQTVDATLAGVSVITRTDIDASGASDLLDLLRLQPGVDLSRTGGGGQQTSVFLRGSNPNHVLVLVDGVRVASANTGGFAWEQLPLDAVERVEIVRGPRASYWGSDAMGGVIQIFTRRLEGPRLALRGGSYGDARGSAGMGAWQGGEGFSVQAGLRHLRGYSATNAGLCSGPDDPYCSFDPDDDGYRSKNLAAQGALRVGSQRLSASLLRNDAEVAYDRGRSFAIEQAAAVNIEGDLVAGWSHRIGLSQYREDLRSPDIGALFLSRRAGLSWTNTLQLAPGQQLVAGLDLLHERGENRDLYAGSALYRDRRDNSAVFAGWQAHAGAWNGEVAGRYDANSEFGGHTTASAAVGLDTSERSRLTASVGSAFHGPNLNEQFNPGYGGYYAGNPDLQPEASRTAELSWGWRPDAVQSWETRAYRSRVRNLIAYTGPKSRAENTAHAQIDGVELSYALHLAAWRVGANTTWQDARDTDNDAELLRRPRHKLAATLERQFSADFSLGAELQAVGRRKDYGADLGGYALLNLRAGWRATPDWQVNARLENLTDRDYALEQGFNTAGRSAWLELVWQPH